LVQRNVIRNVRRALPVLAAMGLMATAARAQGVVRVEPNQPANAQPVAVQPTTVVTQPAVAQPAAPVAAPVAVAPAGDPYGFTNWLNATRAQYGLPAVGYDPNLASWAAVNNGHQSSRGMGHFVMGPARRQNCAMGSYGTIGSMWMASSAHRSALLDPTIRFVGIAGAGAYWTFNAY